MADDPNNPTPPGGDAGQTDPPVEGGASHEEFVLPTPDQPSETSDPVRAQPRHDAQGDPAQQSLADALGVTFFVLKLAMVVLIVVYAGSQVFSVEEQQVAVKLRFGKIVGAEQGTSNAIIEPGGPHFAFPYPINTVVKVPTNEQTLTLDRAFWYELQQADIGKTPDELAQTKTGPLNPELDGSLITGDANIVHAQWTIQYKIANAVDFIEHIAEPSRDPQDVVDAAARLVRLASEQAVISVVARQSADDVIRGSANAGAVQAQAQTTLNDLDSGIEVINVTVSNPTMPFAVRQAYQAANRAENEKSQSINQAEQERARILGEAAGEAYQPLLDLIGSYERLSRGSEQDRAQLPALERQIDAVFRELEVMGDRSAIDIGGEAAAVINQARTYRTRLVAQLKGQARTFESLLPEYNKNPRIVLNRLWQDTREQVLTNEESETFYLPPSQARIDINRDPDVKRERDERRLQEEEQRRREEAASR